MGRSKLGGREARTSIHKRAATRMGGYDRPRRSPNVWRARTEGEKGREAAQEGLLSE